MNKFLSLCLITLLCCTTSMLAQTNSTTTVTAVDPEPYVEGGEFNKEIPAVVTVTMSEGGFNVQENGIIAEYPDGMFTMKTSIDEFTIDGEKLTINIPESLRGKNFITLDIYATDTNGSPITYNNEGAEEATIKLTYRMPSNSYIPESISPEDNSTVESLKQFRLHFNEIPNLYDNTTGITLNNGEGHPIANGTMAWDSGMGIDIIITLDKEVTESGTYTLVIPEKSFSPDFEFNTYNPELIYTYTISVPAVPTTVTSIDPEPYIEGGEFNKEIPAVVTVTMSEGGFNVQENGIIAEYPDGMFTMKTSIDEFTIDSEKLTINIPESLRGKNFITLEIYATDANGTPITYNNEGSEEATIKLTYRLPSNSYIPESIAPENNSTVESLKQFRLHFNEVPNQYDNTTGITLNDVEGNAVANGIMAWDSGMGIDIIITLDKEVTESGTYTLVIPEKSFSPDFDFNTYNPELIYTYTITTPSGINEIATGKNDMVKVYTIDGRLVGEMPSADITTRLENGIYIVDGTKIAVK